MTVADVKAVVIYCIVQRNNLPQNHRLRVS